MVTWGTSEKCRILGLTPRNSDWTRRESKAALSKGPRNCDDQSDLGTTGKDEGGGLLTLRSGLLWALCRAGMSWKLRHLSALNFRIRTEVSKATARENLPGPAGQGAEGQAAALLPATAQRPVCGALPSGARDLRRGLFAAGTSIDIDGKRADARTASSCRREIQEVHDVSRFF